MTVEPSLAGLVELAVHYQAVVQLSLTTGDSAVLISRERFDRLIAQQSVASA